MPVRLTDFEKDVSVGRDAERIVADWFRARRGVASVVDVSDEPDMRQAGIDLTVTLTNGHLHHVDVKSDAFISKNSTLTWELVSNVVTNKPGWGLTSQANWMAFYSPQSAMLYLFQTQAMREHIALRSDAHWDAITCQNRPAWMRSGDVQASLSLKVPISSVEKVGGKSVDLSDFAASRRKEAA